MRAAVPEEQVLLPGPAERRPVGEALTEVGVPGVEMRVEVHQGQRAVLLRGRPQEWEGNGVVTADRHDPPPSPEERIGSRFDLGHCGLEIERGAADVARVDHLGQFEREGLQFGMVGTQQP